MSFRSRRPCPACGNVIEFDPIDVSVWGDQRPRFVAGRAQCRSGCDPRFRRVVVAHNMRHFESVCVDNGWNPRVVVAVLADDRNPAQALYGRAVPDFMVSVNCFTNREIDQALRMAAIYAENETRHRPYPPVPEAEWVDDPEPDQPMPIPHDVREMLLPDYVRDVPWIEDGMYQAGSEGRLDVFTTAHGETYVRSDHFTRYTEARDRARAWADGAQHAEQAAVAASLVGDMWPDDQHVFDAEAFERREAAITSAEDQFRNVPRPSAPEYGETHQGPCAMRSNPHTEETTFRL